MAKSGVEFMGVRWAIWVCPVHVDAVRAADTAPPGESPYCPHAKAEDPHKMRLVIVSQDLVTELEEVTLQRDVLLADRLEEGNPDG